MYSPNISAATSTVDVRINGQQFSVLTLTGKESLTHPFRFEITLVVASPWSDSWLSQVMQLRLPERYIAGVITQETASYFQPDGEVQLQVTLEPRFALLKHQSRAKVFLNKSVIDILQQYFLDAGISNSQIIKQYQRVYPAQSYVFQPPQETDLAFIQRIAASAGLFFWSDVDNHQNEIVRIADSNEIFSRISPIIAYTPLSNLPSPISAQGFYHLAIIGNVIADNFIINDYNENMPDQIIHASSGKCSSAYAQQIFGMGCKDNAEASQLGEYYYQAQQLQLEWLEGESNQSQLGPGKIFQLDATLWNNTSLYNQSYYITEVSHHVQQPAAPQGLGDDVIYQNVVTFVNVKYPFCWVPQSAPVLPKLFVAHIESDSFYSQLDDAGKYTNRLQLDQSNKNYTEAMPTLRRLTPYNSISNHDGASSWHFPLHDRAEILVNHLYGDPNRPVIVGSLYNAEQLSPVTASNYQQHILRTAAHNQLVMDDADASVMIQLQNPGAVNVLQLNAAPGAQQLLLNSQGQINCVAYNNISYTIGQDCNELANDFIQTVAGNFSCGTQQDDFHYYIKQTQQLIAVSGIFFTAQQNISLQSANQLNISAQQIFQINANEELLQVIAEKACVVQSAKDLHIIGSGKGNITFSQGNISIEITEEGAVNFNAPKIVVSGQPVFSVAPG